VSRHDDLILDQFTRQAVPFSTAPGIRDEEALRRLLECSGAGPADTVLDVACGPGLVVAAFAQRCRHVTGIDLTPAMIDRALPLAELLALFGEVGLGTPAITRYDRAADLDGLLSRSYPNPGDGEKVRVFFRESLADDSLGVGAHPREGGIHFAYPVAILVAGRRA
jgi:SAM-dependent methyltransferase